MRHWKTIASGVLGGLLVAVCSVPSLAEAAGPKQDPSRLYDISFSATPKVKPGGQGTVEVRITPKHGAEVHSEAPVRLVLEAPTSLELQKTKLGRPDLKMQGTEATFEVPFSTSAAGPAEIDAQLSFFICTDQICARQQRSAKLPVSVE